MPWVDSVRQSVNGRGWYYYSHVNGNSNKTENDNVHEVEESLGQEMVVARQRVHVQEKAIIGQRNTFEDQD